MPPFFPEEAQALPQAAQQPVQPEASRLRNRRSAVTAHPATKARIRISQIFIRFSFYARPMARPTRRMTSAPTQASRHCQTTREMAHLPPISRLTVAMVATQGV